VSTAAKLMAKKNVGAVLVVEDERLVGIFTERDIAFRVVARGLDAQTTRLAQVMTPSPDTIDPGRPFGYALLRMHESRNRLGPERDGPRARGIRVRGAPAPVLQGEELRSTLDGVNHDARPAMNRKMIAIFAAVLLAPSAAAVQPLKDLAGFKDPGLFARMPGYYLSERSSFKESQFDAYPFTVAEGGRNLQQRVEGHKLVYYYYFDASTGKPHASALQIARNYQNAALKIGGEVLCDTHGPYTATTLRVTRDGRETWAEIQSNGDGQTYYVTIVERQAMQQDVVASADALSSGLAATGHVEVPGIFFDFNKAEIKPESQPALEQVAKLLKDSPALKVWVVGHTDWVGSAETNTALSNARAAAVVRALTQQFGIASGRLAPQGLGPYAPVATNATDEGRAKNRRVELVAQP